MSGVKDGDDAEVGKAMAKTPRAAARRGSTKKARGAKAPAKSTGAPPAIAPLALPAYDTGPVEAPDAAAARIFQIYFEPWQRDLIDPDFIALDNYGEPTEFLEFDLFERLSISKHVEGAELWGALSWRFTEKTGLTSADLRAAILANPGHDVYYSNAVPQHEALYHNLWQQGETAHPRFLELVRAFLTAAGLPADDTDLIMPSNSYSTANYFIGTPAFWTSYLRFVRAAVLRADKVLPDDIRQVLHSDAADDRKVHGGSTYMPFIVERLFPLFMRTVGKHLKGHKLQLTLPQDEINVHLRLLREMKDMAWKTKSPWLAACWVNYRNLYLTHQHGRDWAQKYLRSVTPTDIKFA